MTVQGAQYELDKYWKISYMSLRKVFQLKVTRIGQNCTFELTWDRGKCLHATLDYPQVLSTSYQKWQQAYLNYYRHLRGKIKFKGSVTEPPEEPDFALVQAEVQLLSQFHNWLRCRELYALRATLVRATKDSVDKQPYWIDIFLTCSSLELERLPWEAWEIGTDFGGVGKLRFARKPANICHEPITTRKKTGKARVLAILGNNENLNLKDDVQALQKLSGLISLKFIGWEPGKSKTKLKGEIIEAIADKNGWDVLFFAGHSNETELTGGVLKIAPNASLSMIEIEQPIRQAIENGLQFALFNSCSGINIAQSLINLGLSQVAVMREPIHDLVAQEFLAEFLKSLATRKDVHEALLDSCQFLKQDKSYTYPSSYLIPSLFCNPQSELFRIETSRVIQNIKSWLPTKLEVVSLTTVLALSLLPLVQDLLLEPRILVQAFYRNLTAKESKFEGKPPVFLIEVDRKSIKNIKDKIELSEHKYMNHAYLAKIVESLENYQVKIIGMHYILDIIASEEQRDKSHKLVESLKNLVKNNNTQIVLAVENNDNPNKIDVELIPEIGKQLPEILKGYINFYRWFIELPENSECLNRLSELQVFVEDNTQTSSPNCPFAYLLAQNNEFSIKRKLHPISKHFQWFQPLLDFSIPPEQIYAKISACEFLETCGGKFNEYKNPEKQVVIIGAGGYEIPEEKNNVDNFAVPLAIKFWRGESNFFTSSEAHAYMVHHLLEDRLVIPIPDFLMIFIAALLGKGMTIVLLDNREQQEQWVRLLGCATVVYALVGLQVYISSGLLLPLFLPSTVFWNYIRVATGCKN